MDILGAHMSIAGGLHKAFTRGAETGCNAIQIFTKNANQWREAVVSDEEKTSFSMMWENTGIATAWSHDSYLINLATPDDELYGKSINAFEAEMIRSEMLGLPYVVMHPGAHMGSGIDRGIKRIAAAMNVLHEKCKGFAVKIVIETTAGQGTHIGFRFEQLRSILDCVDESERLAICLDTCHIFAAGYDISSRKGYNKVMKEFDRVLGMGRLAIIHLNDSKKGLGSRVDRHEHIGKGMLGTRPFSYILNDEKLVSIPKVIETKKEKNDKGIDMDIINLSLLRSLIKS